MHWNTKITRKCDELEHYYVFETWKVMKTLTIDLQRSPIQSETMMRELHRGQIGGKYDDGCCGQIQGTRW